MDTAASPAILTPMTTLARRRLARLLPGGIPRYVRCYRDDSCPLDPWTVIFTGSAASKSNGGQYPYVGLTGHGATDHQPADTIKDRPGNGYRWPPAMGRKCHLGVRVAWSELPEHLRRVALEDYRAIWRLDA